MARSQAEIYAEIMAAIKETMAANGGIMFTPAVLMLSQVMGKPAVEIMYFVRLNVISYADLYGFYLLHSRFPTRDECRFIYDIGFDNYKSLVDSGIR